MGEGSNRERAEKALCDWHGGTSSITDLLADGVRWMLDGRSQVSKTFDSKEQFIGEVPRPFVARFSQTLRPMTVCGVYADGDTVLVLWDGEGTRRDGNPYKNTYAWFMRFREGLVVEATAFFDSIAFDELQSEVALANQQKISQSTASDADHSDFLEFGVYSPSRWRYSGDQGLSTSPRLRAVSSEDCSVCLWRA